MPGEHDAALERGEALQEFFGATHYRFVWRSMSSSGRAQAMRPSSPARQGYNLRHWHAQGIQYWAVSDTAAENLATLAKLLR